ncbi:TonB-dependent receptor [Candidatus Pelagibacter ubique]|nr:TonB-dependent receptor [Candidatus Pelagibacter ubique]
MRILFLSLILFFNFFEFAKVYAKDIPIIVISAGKSPQSKNTVGSDVTVIDRKTIENSNEYFIGDILDNNLNGMNQFQNGGYGAVAGIQLRGQPKRYTTVYIDGVKVSDPSTPSNDYYFNNLVSGSFDRVEILKGAQSSLYGSGALAGTVQLFSKKGQEGHNNNINISAGSFNTQKVDLSFDGKYDNYDYFVGYTNFATDGESAMTDNSEKDGYRSDSLTMNYGYNFNENLRVESYLYHNDSFLEYDAVNNTQTDSNDVTDDQSTSYTGRLIYDTGNLKNTISYNNTYILRNTTGYNLAKTNYYGYRDAINLLSEYNFDLDNRIIFGLDNEFDAAELKSYYAGNKYKESDEAIYSQYFDLQLRLRENTYTTFGLRRDDHTTAGDYYTGRATITYKVDNNTKLRGNLGTSVRFPSLNSYHHGHSLKNKESLKAETGKSIDIGIEKFFPENNISISATTFFLEYKNDIKGWASHGGGLQYSYSGEADEYVIDNSNSKTESYGLEFQTNWKLNNDYALGLGYTRTESYDGTTCDNPDSSAGPGSAACIDEMNVRVPRHQINLIGTKIFNNNLSQTLKIKYVGERRDYGNTNNNFEDVILSEYLTADLITNYKLFNAYNLNISAKNILNKKYSEAYEYKAPGRSVNLKLKKQF